MHRLAFARDPATGVQRAPDDVVEARLVDRLRADTGALAHLVHALLAVAEAAGGARRGPDGGTLRYAAPVDLP